MNIIYPLSSQSFARAPKSISICKNQWGKALSTKKRKDSKIRDDSVWRLVEAAPLVAIFCPGFFAHVPAGSLMCYPKKALKSACLILACHFCWAWVLSNDVFSFSFEHGWGSWCMCMCKFSTYILLLGIGFRDCFKTAIVFWHTWNLIGSQGCNRAFSTCPIIFL